MLGRTITWVAVVGALVVLSGPLVPGWLVVIVLAAILPLCVIATIKRSRIERDLARALWRRLTRRA